MKVALIPPKGYESYALHSNYHLALAQELGTRVTPITTYQRTYAYIASDQYLIVDNGAAEGAAVDDSDLIATMVAFAADEIVLPDVMLDWKETTNRVDAFMERYEDELSDSPTRAMLVLQGTSLDEVNRCIGHYLDRYDNFVFGVPRHFLTTLDDKYGRLEVLRLLADSNAFHDNDVHLLGTNPLFPDEVKLIAKDFPEVRGVDTSMPFNYSINHQTLSADVSYKRPDGYFTLQYMIMSDLLERNIDTFLEWASGTEGSSS